VVDVAHESAEHDLADPRLFPERWRRCRTAR
jgi:hypothetical protein